MTGVSERLDAIEARKNAATPGPWEPMKAGLLGTRVVHVEGEWEDLIPDEFVTLVTPALRKPADAVFIAHAPQDITDLLDLARKQQAAIDRVESLAKYLDSLADGDKHYARLIRAAITGEGA